ncbi:MAG TPA: hypothetical protein VFG56_01570 [Candidatus Saccharimonadales bacterium]|nr:hypothetical protein [Candidatus Saccharimonadales bacterium]
MREEYEKVQSFDELREKFPDFSDAIDQLEREQKKAPKRRGSGSTRPIASRLKVPPR